MDRALGKIAMILALMGVSVTRAPSAAGAEHTDSPVARERMLYEVTSWIHGQARSARTHAERGRHLAAFTTASAIMGSGPETMTRHEYRGALIQTMARPSTGVQHLFSGMGRRIERASKAEVPPFGDVARILRDSRAMLLADFERPAALALEALELRHQALEEFLSSGLRHQTLGPAHLAVVTEAVRQHIGAVVETSSAWLKKPRPPTAEIQFKLKMDSAPGLHAEAKAIHGLMTEVQKDFARIGQTAASQSEDANTPSVLRTCMKQLSDACGAAESPVFVKNLSDLDSAERETRDPVGFTFHY